MKKIGYGMLIVLASVLLHGCKGTKVATGTAVQKLKAEKIIANHYTKSFNYNTLNARVKVRYEDADKSVSPNVTLRMEKDKKIWVSAKVLGITVAKALITPTKVSYYEKITNTYFDGDFKLLSEWLGTSLDFEKVQQLLLGQAIFDLRTEKYQSDIDQQHYQLVPKKQLALFERLFLVYPATYKMHTQQLKQHSEKRDLTITYESYQKVGNQDFPKNIHIRAVEGVDTTTIQVEYRAVDYNPKVSFPFKIPSGYEQVTIE